MIRSLLVATAAISLAACATATLPGGNAVAPIDTAELSEHIRVLSSDEFMGRGIATPGEQMTIDYVTRQWAEAGFQPGGPNGQWVQPVTLRRFEVSDASGELSVGDWSVDLVQGENAVISTRLPGQPHVMLHDAPLVFVGYGINAPERGWNDYEGLDMRGKIAVVLINDADFEDPSLDTFNGRAMTYYGRWTYKYEEAARQGAAGVIIVHEDAPASYGWNTVRNSWTGPQFDIVRQNPSAERTAVEAWVTRDTAVELFRQAGLDFDALKTRARARGFRGVPLPGASADIHYNLASDTIETNNIVGRLPGTTHPEETILYTAHWDHIGIGEPDANGDAIFNGAVDNATGTTALIELARLFGSGPRPERSIVLIGFTAEESGLLGSEYYAANPIYPVATTVAGFNIDGMNVIGPMVDVSVTGSGYSSLEQNLARHAAMQNRTVSPDSSPEAGYYFRSDHFPLAKRGVPMLYADGGTALVVGGRAAVVAAEDDYRANRYHQADDEWSASWNLEGMAQDIMLLYGIGREIANSREWPTWNEGTEFRPVRDQTAGQRR